MRQLNQMLQQAQQMKKKMEEMQQHLENVNFDGQSGAGMVKATVNGKGDVQKFKIDQSLMNPDEVEILEDLLVAAINDAKNKATSYSADEMSKITGNLKLPGGMKLPF